MGKILRSGLCLMMLLMMLTGCGPSTVSDTRIKEELLNLSDVKNYVDTVDTITVLSKQESNKTIDLQLSVQYDSLTCGMMANVTLNFTKKGWNWVLSDHTFEVVSISAKQDPSVQAATIDVIRKISEGMVNNHSSGIYYVEPKGYSLKSLNSDKEHGKATLVVQEEYKDATWGERAEYTVNAEFVFKKGWVYTLTDWAHIQTMKWKGSYDFEFTNWSDMSQWGHDMPTDSFFTVGDKITDLKIDGDLTIIDRMNGDQTATIPTVSFTFKGQSYQFTPEIEDKGRILRIVVDPSSPYYGFFSLVYLSASQYDNRITPAYLLDAGEFTGTLIRKP